MGGEVSIVAVGAHTAVGFRAESAAAAVRAGISRVVEHPQLVSETGQPLRCAPDPAVAALRAGWARAAALTIAALSEVFQKLADDRQPETSINLWLAVPDFRPGFERRETAALVEQVQTTAFPGVARLQIETISAGHAGPLKAMEGAIQQMAARRAEITVVAGADSYFDTASLRWLASENRLAVDGVRGGFVPGEAAGAIVLANRGTRVRRNWPALAHVRAVASGREQRAADSDEGVLGEGLTDVVARVTAHLRLPDESIDELYCDIGHERFRADEWAYTALRLPKTCKDPTAYVTPVSAWGDVGAASGALACVLAVQGWRRRSGQGRRALVWASSPTGLRGATVLEQAGA